MVGELLCPDCGGVVGATQTTEAGPPCRCFVSTANESSSGSTLQGQTHDPSAEALSGSLSDGAADVTSESSGSADVAAVTKPKICIICGKDLAGHRRVRDSRGYLCYNCAKEEEKREFHGRVACKVCGHLTKEETMVVYEGTRMCARCHEDRLNIQKTEIKRMGVKGARTRAELRRIYGIAVILALLLAVILYGFIHSLTHHH